MRFKLLAVLGLIFGALAFAAPAFASTTDGWNNNPGWNQDCVNVVTPPIQNLTYIPNTNTETVIVTLTGNYYWVQVKEVGGKEDFLGPTTTTVVLTPGESISLAWGGSKHKSTIAGPHTWLWTGLQNCYYPRHHHWTNYPDWTPGWTPSWTPCEGQYWQPQVVHNW